MAMAILQELVSRKLFEDMAKQLDVKSMIALSQVCKDLRQIRTVPPSDINIEEEYENKTRAEGGCKDGYYRLDCSGSVESIARWLHVEVPESSKICMVSITFRWRDQGWGYRKGCIWINIPNDTVESEEGKQIMRGLATRGPAGPWRLQPGQVKKPDDPVPETNASWPGWVQERIDIAWPQDSNAKWFDVMYRVGGGGGHTLHIQDFKIQVVEWLH